MDIEAIITEFEAALSQQVAMAGDDPAVQAAGDAILAALYPAGRQIVMRAAEQAAVEIDAQLAEHRVDVVLADGEPALRVRASEEEGAPFPMSDLEARLTLRLPEALKQAVEDAAAGAGDSVNAYVVKTLGSKAARPRQPARPASAGDHPDMSDRTERFEVGSGPRLQVRIGSGEVVLMPGEEGVVEVSLEGSGVDDVVVERRGNTIVVEQAGTRRLRRTIDVVATVPTSVVVEAKLGSADLTARMAVAEVDVAAGAGDIRIDTVNGMAAIASGSGDVTIGSVTGRISASVASGDLSIRDAADELEAKSAAGDIRVGRVGGRVVVRTASGDVDIARFEGPDLVGQSMSGDVRIGIPSGRILDVDVETLAGDVRNEFDIAEAAPGPARVARLRVKTLSGDVVLGSARS